MSWPPDFMECPTCAAKPGSPPLCNACLHNREAISRLQNAARIQWEAGFTAGYRAGRKEAEPELTQKVLNRFTATMQDAIDELKEEYGQQEQSNADTPQGPMG